MLIEAARNERDELRASKEDPGEQREDVVDASDAAEEETEDPDVVRSLEKELRECQKEVIQLQRKIIQLQDEDISITARAVTESVRREMKSWSSVVSNNYAAAVAPSKLQAVIQRTVHDVVEETDRNKDLLIFNLEEGEDEESPDAAVTELMEELHEKFPFSDCKRIGNRSEGRARPFIAKLDSRDSLLALELKKSQCFSKVFLGPDRTIEERAERCRTLESIDITETESREPVETICVEKGSH